MALRALFRRSRLWGALASTAIVLVFLRLGTWQLGVRFSGVPRSGPSAATGG